MLVWDPNCWKEGHVIILLHGGNTRYYSCDNVFTVCSTPLFKERVTFVFREAFRNSHTSPSQVLYTPQLIDAHPLPFSCVISLSAMPWKRGILVLLSWASDIQKTSGRRGERDRKKTELFPTQFALSDRQTVLHKRLSRNTSHLHPDPVITMTITRRLKPRRSFRPQPLL